MSYTTILAAFADGRLVGFEDAKNAWHGAMTIWNWTAQNYCGMQCFPLTDRAESQKVWDVWQREEVPIDIRLAMMTTLDGVLLRADLAERVAVALETFPVETDNLQTQARAIRAAFAQGARAVGWVQNSCVDGWCGPCYNIDTDRSHHWISLEGLIQEESDDDSDEDSGDLLAPAAEVTPRSELAKLRTVATHARALVQLADLCVKEKEGAELPRQYVRTMRWLRESVQALDAVEGAAESCKTPSV